MSVLFGLQCALQQLHLPRSGGQHHRSSDPGDATDLWHTIHGEVRTKSGTVVRHVIFWDFKSGLGVGKCHVEMFRTVYHFVFEHGPKIKHYINEFDRWSQS